MESTYIFSVIMGVYNVDPYIKDAVDSVIQQDFGFEDKVQIILVDDGSTDQSGAICDEYATLYPQNVFVIHQENKGVATARNVGLSYASGKYVNFMDPDDMLSNDAFSVVASFFEEHELETDIVTIPLDYFDGRTGPHPTNKYKFSKGDRVIDLYREYRAIITSCAASFIKLETAKTIHFDAQLFSMEDAKALLSVLVNKHTVGVVCKPKYHYRKRTVGESSLSDSAKMNPKWYSDFLRRFSYWVLNYFEEKLGYVPFYAQYTVMYELQWKFSQSEIPAHVLTEFETEEYKQLLFHIITKIDDRIILMQDNLYSEHKAFILAKKYNEAPAVVFTLNSTNVHIHNNFIYSMDCLPIYVDFIRISDNKMIIEGNVVALGWELEGEGKVCIKANDEYIECDMFERYDDRCVLDEVILRKIGFMGVIPLCTKLNDLTFYYTYCCCLIYLYLHLNTNLQYNILWGC